MLFWFLAAGMVAAVVLVLLMAITPKPLASGGGDFDVAFYKSREAEIARLEAEGLMAADDAKAALAEAARRLIGVKRGGSAAIGSDASRRRLAQALTVLAIPALTLSLYLTQGRPELPGMPYASRTDLNRSDEELTRLIGRLDAHLADSPDDARGWELAFPVYMRLGRFENAVAAAERLIALKGDTPERQASLAEALIFNARGVVGDAAKAAIDKALAGDPKLARARFYRGLAAEQSGDLDGARAVWQALHDDLPDGNEKTAIRSNLARLGPTGAAADAIRSLPEAERRTAIRGMVDALAIRLKQDGGSAEDWQKLIRALAVLGERDKLIAAVAEARAAFRGKDGAAAIEALAGELGLPAEAKP